MVAEHNDTSFFQLFQYCLGSELGIIGDFSSEQLQPDQIKAFSRRSRAATAKKCTKKRDARAKLLFWLLNLLLFDVLVAVAVAVVGS